MIKRKLKKLLEIVRNLIKAGLDELYLIQKEGLFCRQFKGKGGEKK